MKFGLKQDVIDQINNIFARYPQIDKAVIYGSRAKGNHKNGSDIDLTLFGKYLTLPLLNKINTEIDDLLLPYTIDISINNHISNKELLEHIERVGKIFYSNENR